MVSYICGQCKTNYTKPKWSNYKCPCCETFNFPLGSREIVIKDAIERNNHLIRIIYAKNYPGIRLEGCPSLA